MNPLKAWGKICRSLDGFLWHRNIRHRLIRPMLRNMILASGLCVLAGGALWAVWPPVFWFASGFVCMTWIFWSWGRVFHRVPMDNFGAALLRLVLAGFFLRLVLLAVLLYIALAIFNASAAAIAAGMAAGGFLGLALYARSAREPF